MDVDVVIVGAGLAGLSLARQLLLRDPARRVLQVDKRDQIPPPGQKVGEATVQVSGYYFSKVLELEEYLLREHYLKYNLRFYWKTAGTATQIESYSQSYIRGMSNVATYQLNRNELERELLRRNVEHPSYRLDLAARDIDVALDADGTQPHRVTYSADGVRRSVSATWVVDATGRSHLLSRRHGLERPNPIRHGASFFWVDGLVNVERLTDASATASRLSPARRWLGHMPQWLATNHFCEEGLWFWVIPLHGITSLGLVYDNRRVDPETVNDPAKIIPWICEHFPIFARDLPNRTVLRWSCYRDFSFDCAQTIDRGRWALIGEAGRWSDPLYSPGADLIAIHNTLLTDAIGITDAAELAEKTALYEQLQRALYEAYIPSYAVSYDCLGDQEAFTLKYTWEVTIYFAFYVFPVLNDFFTDKRFVVSFLQRFARLGRVNTALQAFLNDFYHWKKLAREPQHTPVYADFFATGGLAVAEKTFYDIGVSIDEARRVLDDQVRNALLLARLTVAHVYASVLDEPAVFRNREFLESLDVERVKFDADEMRAAYARYAACTSRYTWPEGWNPLAFMHLCTPRRAVETDA